MAQVPSASGLAPPTASWRGGGRLSNLPSSAPAVPSNAPAVPNGSVDDGGVAAARIEEDSKEQGAASAERQDEEPSPDAQGGASNALLDTLDDAAGPTQRRSSYQRLSAPQRLTAQPQPQKAERRSVNFSGDLPRPRRTSHALAEGLEPRTSLCALAQSEQGIREHTLAARLLAECVGTFMLVLAVGTAATGGNHAPLAIGGVLAVQIYTFGSVSGGLFNPAVAFAVLLSGRQKITPRDFLAYVAAELVGGLLGGCLALLFADQTFYFDFEKSALQDGGVCCLLELLYTAALCIAVLTTGTSSDAPNDYFGFAIGGTVTASAIACGSFDQGSFNPAVTLGINVAHLLNSDGVGSPSVASWFLYLFVPFAGSILGAGVFVLTRGPELRNQAGEEHSTLEKLIAEGFGTFYLVLTAGIAGGALAPVGVGVMLAVQVYSFGAVSGACLNPAVTFAVLLSGRKKIHPLDGFLYMCTQFGAAWLAAATAWGLTDRTVQLKEAGVGSGLGQEVVFTFAICMTVLTTATSRDATNQYFGFAIGGTVTACAYAASAHHAGSFNPAVTFGIMLADTCAGTSQAFSSWAVYIVGPWLGGALAAAVFFLTRRAEYVDEVDSDPLTELAIMINGIEERAAGKAPKVETMMSSE